jgi:hypothetical protein
MIGGLQVIVDPRDAAESAGLRYVSDDEPGLRRRKTGKGFSYTKPDGKSVRDKATRERIRKLAIARRIVVRARIPRRRVDARLRIIRHR